MSFTQVAIVPLESDKDHPLRPAELLRLAAAIQIHVQRDLGPRWGLYAAVSPFHSLEEVPPGYWPVSVTMDQGFPVDGFHFAMQGLPFGVVKYSDQLSISLSHELSEMLVDPTGQRIASGPNLDPSAGGQVDYFVEVCDACQYSTYPINGLQMSDFVLPGYYDTEGPRSQGYSFTGAVTQPRQVLEQCYVSYRDPFPGSQVYQAFALPAASNAQQAKLVAAGATTIPQPNIAQPNIALPDLTIAQLPNAPTRAWRELIAAESAPRTGPTQAAALPLAGAVVSDDFVSEFRGNVENLAAAMEDKTPPPSTREVLTLMEALAANSRRLASFHGKQTERDKRLQAIRLTQTRRDPLNETKQDMSDRYQAVVKYLKQQESLSGLFGPDLDSDLSFWMFMLMP